MHSRLLLYSVCKEMIAVTFLNVALGINTIKRYLVTATLYKLITQIFAVKNHAILKLVTNKQLLHP